MAFSDEVIQRAWERAGGQCECQRRTHRHFYNPCGKQLVWAMRGRDGRGGWEADKIAFTGEDTLRNCEVLCWDCHDSIMR
ncbi:MAG: hypothetical protein HYX84_08820 [Chloroflexi bacterium]|nr:hypothetical protein [Chloroflexota bacterium]